LLGSRVVVSQYIMGLVAVVCPEVVAVVVPLAVVVVALPVGEDAGRVALCNNRLSLPWLSYSRVPGFHPVSAARKKLSVFRPTELNSTLGI